MAHDPPTRRAGRACLSCRSRKIRCNFEECGPPCSNCLTDDIECFTAKSRRGKRPYRHLRNKAKASRARDAPAADTTPVKPNVKGRRATVLLSEAFPTHTAGWLDDNVESDLLSQYDVNGMQLRALLHIHYFLRRLTLAPDSTQRLCCSTGRTLFTPGVNLCISC